MRQHLFGEAPPRSLAGHVFTIVTRQGVTMILPFICGCKSAKIDEFARLVEDEGEAVVRIERLRADLAVREDDRVRNVVVIDEHAPLCRPSPSISAGVKVKLSMATCRLFGRAAPRSGPVSDARATTSASLR